MPERSPQAMVATIVAAGFTPVDAARWVREAAAMLPPGADPATWLPDPGAFAMTAVIDEAAVQDTRIDWYVNAPLEFKLLLDDLGGGTQDIGLFAAVFYDPLLDVDLFNPYHEPAGSPIGGRFAFAGGAAMNTRGIRNQSQLQRFAELPPATDGTWDYLTHAVRYDSELDDIVSNGLTSKSGVVYTSPSPLVRDRGAGFVILRVPAGAGEKSEDVVERGLRFPQVTFTSLPADSVIRVVRFIQTDPGGHGVREDELARYALTHQGLHDADVLALPKRYQKWFNLPGELSEPAHADLFNPNHELAGSPIDGPGGVGCLTC